MRSLDLRPRGAPVGRWAEAEASRPPRTVSRSLGMRASLFGLAALLSGYLAWASLTGGGIAGCGPQSACNRVLQSRWAYWLGIPVSVPATAVYVLLLTATLRRIFAVRRSRPQPQRGWPLLLSHLVIAAAIWFGFLQAAVIREFCIFCLVTHAAAATAAGSELMESMRGASSSFALARRAWPGALGALFAAALLIAGQVVMTAPTNRVSAMAAPVVASPAQDAGRVLSLYNGRFQLELNSTPRIGPASAPNIATMLFDYTCSHCRDLHQLLERAQERFGEQLAIVTLPMPLDRSCNHLVQHTASENANACDYARLALAVWRANPPAFRPFNAFIFTPPRPPTIDAAREHAGRLVGSRALQQAMADDWGKRQLQIAIELFEANSRRSGAWQIPQLMIGNSLSVGSIGTAEALHSLLREHLELKHSD